MERIASTLFVLAIFLSGCAPQLDPAWLDERSVTYVNDASRTFSVPEGMVFYDTSPATRGIGFPAGIYGLEAEDDDYYYFRSAEPLDCRVFKDGKVSDRRLIPGGIMFAKRFSTIPAGGYIDAEDPKKKLAVWKLGREFLAQKGAVWTVKLE